MRRRRNSPLQWWGMAKQRNKTKELKKKKNAEIMEMKMTSAYHRWWRHRITLRCPNDCPFKQRCFASHTHGRFAAPLNNSVVYTRMTSESPHSPQFSFYAFRGNFSRSVWKCVLMASALVGFRRYAIECFHHRVNCRRVSGRVELVCCRRLWMITLSKRADTQTFTRTISIQATIRMRSYVIPAKWNKNIVDGKCSLALVPCHRRCWQVARLREYYLWDFAAYSGMSFSCVVLRK